MYSEIAGNYTTFHADWTRKVTLNPGFNIASAWMDARKSAHLHQGESTPQLQLARPEHTWYDENFSPVTLAGPVPARNQDCADAGTDPQV